MTDDALDDHVLAPGTAPTPFSAAEIRDGCPAGRTVVVRVEDRGGVRHRLSRFAAVTHEGALYERADCDADGNTVGEVAAVPVTWVDLQRHASFPERTTTRDETSLDYALGHEDCLRYLVVDGDDLTIFWFSRRRPGMPVKVVTHQGGQLLSTSVMVSDRVDATPPG